MSQNLKEPPFEGAPARRKNNHNVIGGKCRNGHDLVGHNIIVQKGKDRADYIRCRVCQYNKQRAKRGVEEHQSVDDIKKRSDTHCPQGHRYPEGWNRKRWCRVCRREKDLAQKYGLTAEQFDALMDDQGGRCAICRSDFETADPRHVHVDHNHETGAVRGILCHNCNTMLGLVHDDTSKLQAAIDYLGTT